MSFMPQNSTTSVTENSGSEFDVCVMITSESGATELGLAVTVTFGISGKAGK